MSEIKYMDIKEFQSEGYLQEVNRRFFHPLGLALEILIEEDGEFRLGGIWDYREDPEGIYYEDSLARLPIFKQRIERFDKKFLEKGNTRFHELGYVIQQPLEDK